MNEGVKILLERMKTNPDEFVGEAYSASKWGGLIMQYRDYLNEEDKKALNDALNELTQQKFTEAVMKELLAPEEDDSLGKQWYTANATPTVGQTLASSLAQSKAMSMGATLSVGTNPCSLTLGSTTINESHLEHMKAQVEALKKEVNKQKKPHKTLFGKLFNYT